MSGLDALPLGHMALWGYAIYIALAHLASTNLSLSSVKNQICDSDSSEISGLLSVITSIV